MTSKIMVLLTLIQRKICLNLSREAAQSIFPQA
jgi:hypothetical protein